MQNILQVINVTIPLCHLDNHVFDLYLKVLPNLMGKYSVHESLVCGTNVLEAEGCDTVVVVMV